MALTRCLPVGGHAIADHGYSRFTGDLDVWGAADEENAGRFVGALREFGFDLPQLSDDHFLDSVDGLDVRPVGTGP